MSFEIVIAHYNERLGWVYQLDSKIKITIYSKGGDIRGIPLPNVGREAHTYLTHIINNYDNLSDFIIFCQGDPFPHCPNFIEEVNKVVNSNELAESTFLGFGNIWEENLVTDFKDHPRANGVVGTTVDLFKFQNNLGYSLIHEDKVRFFQGAMFLVSKKLMLDNELHFYKKCNSLLDQDIDPDDSYNLERVWNLIFSQDNKKIMK